MFKLQFTLFNTYSTDSFLKFIITFCAVFLCMDWTYIFVNIITHFRVDVQWFMLLFPFFKTYSTEVLPRFHFGYSLSAQKCNSAKKTRLRVRINFKNLETCYAFIVIKIRRQIKIYTQRLIFPCILPWRSRCRLFLDRNVVESRHSACAPKGILRQ